MSESTALISKLVSAGSTYHNWNEDYAKSTGTYFQNHADGMRFNGEVSYSVQKINQARKGEIDSSYYNRFSKMQETIARGSISEVGGAGNEIYFVDRDKLKNSAVVSYFKYNQDNKMNESQVFHYQSNVLTGRTRFIHNSIGKPIKSERFNIHNKLVESNNFIYKNDNVGNDLIIIQKENRHGNKITRTTRKELYDFSGKMVKVDVYDKNDNHLERNEFSYFNNGNKCQIIKSTFNSSGNLSSQGKMIYKKNGDLFGRVELNYNNGKYLKDSKSIYYTKGEVSRIIEDEYSTDGKIIIGKIEKIYDITNTKLVKDIMSTYSENGDLKREVERKLDVNGKVSEHISRYYSDGINLTRHITRSFAAGKMTAGVDIKFDNNGNVSRIKRRTSEGVIVDEPINATTDTFFKGITQLTDAINSFSDGERALTPAPVENAVNGFLVQRNLVPDMNYATRL